MSFILCCSLCPPSRTFENEERCVDKRKIHILCKETSSRLTFISLQDRIVVMTTLSFRSFTKMFYCCSSVCVNMKFHSHFRLTIARTTMKVKTLFQNFTEFSETFALKFNIDFLTHFPRGNDAISALISICRSICRLIFYPFHWIKSASILSYEKKIFFASVVSMVRSQ